MDNTIIELKEGDVFKDSYQPNGSFDVSLKQPLVLNNGDSMSIKNSFIDTIASSGGLITLSDDITATIKFCRGFSYNTGITGNDGNAENTIKETGGANGYQKNIDVNVDNLDVRHQFRILDRQTGVAPKGDGLTYFQLEKHNVDNTGAHFIIANSLTFGSDFSSSGGSHFGGVQVLFAYKGIDGQVHQINIGLTNVRASGTHDEQFTQQLGDDSFVFDNRFTGDGKGYMSGPIEVLSNPDDLRKNHNLDANFDFTGPNFSGGDTFTLKQEKIDLQISKGAYDPNDLARIITDKMVQVNTDIRTILTIEKSFSPFTSPLYDFANNESDDGIGRFICQDNEILLELIYDNQQTPSTTFNRPLVGANQFSFVFDGQAGGTNTFKFVSLHSPFYVNIAPAKQPPNLQIGNQFFMENRGGGNQFTPFIDTKMGEIIILGLDAVDINNNPVDFWFGKLGLSPDIITNTGNHQSFKYNPSGGPEATVQITKINYQNGINSTGLFRGTDSMFPKDKLVPTTADFASTTPQLFTNLMTTPIFGAKTLAEITDTTGYFLIEITGYNNDSRVIGNSDVASSISAIVSRYYASTSFTNGYEQDSIIYQHIGESITVSDLRVRILDPNKLPAFGIGNNSTVFLQIDRALPTQEDIEKKK